MIGLKRGTVKLLPHNPKWKDLFEEEKRILKDALGGLVVDIQHIGSTSIPGIMAKPIIDIEVGIKDLNIRNVESLAEILESLSYDWIRQNSNPENYVFVKGPDEKRTHYLHLVEYEGIVWKNDVSFRNYLRENFQIAQEYEQLKTKLAHKYPKEREKYTKGKVRFFNKVLKLLETKNL